MVEVPQSTRNELYRLPPEAFTDAREERADQARDMGEAELATAIRRLRRPTTAAWAVNLLSAHESERLSTLMDVGQRLRSARSSGAGAELRRGDQERVDLTRVLADRAAELAAGQGRPLKPAMLDQVTETLNAAVSDADAAAAVREGALTKPLAYSGFGSNLQPPEPAPPTASGRSGESGDRRALDEARADSEQAERTAAQLEQELHRVRDKRECAVQQRDEARAELERCERELREADSAVDSVQRRRDQADEERSAARRRVDDLTRA